MPGRSPVSGNASARHCHGVALIPTIIILFLLGALGAALIGMVYTRLSSVSLEVDRLQASYLAEAGLARAIYEINHDEDAFGADGIGVISPTAFGPGYFRVEHKPESRSLIGVGVVREVWRVIVNTY